LTPASSYLQTASLTVASAHHPGFRPSVAHLDFNFVHLINRVVVCDDRPSVETMTPEPTGLPMACSRFGIAARLIEKLEGIHPALRRHLL
jgi:hypothetical protein